MSKGRSRIYSGQFSRLTGMGLFLWVGLLMPTQVFSEEQIFKYVDEDGNIIYTDETREDLKPLGAVELPPPPSPESVEEAEAIHQRTRETADRAQASRLAEEAARRSEEKAEQDKRPVREPGQSEILEEPVRDVIYTGDRSLTPAERRELERRKEAREAIREELREKRSPGVEAPGQRPGIALPGRPKAP